MEAGPGPGPRVCCKPGGRLDMNHGFVHHIRRNQIARDNYDKKVKQAAKEKVRRRHTPAPTRPRKPDMQVYLPRHRGEAARPACLKPARSSCNALPFSVGKNYFLSPRLSSLRLFPEPPLQRSQISAQC
uniref:Chromosome 2 open reading frame 68 n=1 Tax=Propithecus coquereli TaxID=379532 RepID=A0A2K6FCR7_PROCO